MGRELLILIQSLFIKVNKLLLTNNSLKSFSKKLKKFKNIIPLLLISTLSLFYLYFYFIGRERYFIKSDIVVRKVEDEASGLNLANFLSSVNQSSFEDALFLKTYLESPQVYESLQKEIDFNKEYKKEGLDIFAGISSKTSNDKKYNFFRKQISVGFDSASGILRIRTLAFNPETAHNINKFLIMEAEKFVNQLNQSVYKKQKEFVNKEVIENYKKVQKASIDLSEFQKQNKIFDANNEASAGMLLINNLEMLLAKEKINLAKLQRQYVNPDDPEIEYKIKNIEEIQNQINNERNTLLSTTGKDLTKKAYKLKELELNLGFYNDLYQSSLKASEKNRLDSIRKQRFIAIITKPVKPEDQYQYWRHRGFLTSIAIFLVSFLLTRFIISIADNREY